MTNAQNVIQKKEHRAYQKNVTTRYKVVILAPLALNLCNGINIKTVYSLNLYSSWLRNFTQESDLSLVVHDSLLYIIFKYYYLCLFYQTTVSFPVFYICHFHFIFILPFLDFANFVTITVIIIFVISFANFVNLHFAIFKKNCNNKRDAYQKLWPHFVTYASSINSKHTGLNKWWENITEKLHISYYYFKDQNICKNYKSDMAACW